MAYNLMVVEMLASPKEIELVDLETLFWALYIQISVWSTKSLDVLTLDFMFPVFKLEIYFTLMGSTSS